LKETVKNGPLEGGRDRQRKSDLAPQMIGKRGQKLKGKKRDNPRTNPDTRQFRVGGGREGRKEVWVLQSIGWAREHCHPLNSE